MAANYVINSVTKLREPIEKDGALIQKVTINLGVEGASRDFNRNYIISVPISGKDTLDGISKKIQQAAEDFVKNEMKKKQ